MKETINLPPSFAFVEVYGEDVNGPTRWALTCGGLQWGPEPRDASGASSASWATKREAADFLRRNEPHVVSEGGTAEDAAYWAARNAKVKP
jgi:hypothetical protein